MYDARELTVEQIGAVLGVSRTSIYRALGKATPAKETAGGASALASRVPATVGGAPVVVRSRGRSRWFVVEADLADPEHGPVAVVSATPARRRRWPRWAGPEAGRRRAWGRGRCCRSGPPGRSAPGWCGTARPSGGSCSPGRRRDRLAVRRRINMDGASAQPLLTGKRWSTGRLSACRYGWKRLT